MTYKIMVDRYKQRINEIKSNIPVLESIVSGEKSKGNVEKEAILKVED